MSENFYDESINPEPQHHCMTDSESKIPMAMDMPDPGPIADGARTTCAVCGARWVLRDVVGFVVWQPDTQGVTR